MKTQTVRNSTLAGLIAVGVALPGFAAEEPVASDIGTLDKETAAKASERPQNGMT